MNFGGGNGTVDLFSVSGMTKFLEEDNMIDCLITRSEWKQNCDNR